MEVAAWKMLKNWEGVRFRSFDRFCLERQPWGLGTDPKEVRRLLEALVGPRRASLLTAPPSNQGLRPSAENTHGKEQEHATSRPRGEKSTRHEQRRRAIAERAPTPVKRLCELGVLTYKEAAELSPAKPTPEKQAAVESFALSAVGILDALGESPSERDLAEARAKIKRLLPPRKPGESERPMQPASSGAYTPDVQTGNVATSTSSKSLQDIRLLPGLVTEAVSDGSDIEAACRKLRGEAPEQKSVTKTIILEVPEDLHDLLQRVAAERGAAIEKLVLDGITLVLGHCELEREGSDLDPSASIAAE